MSQNSSSPRPRPRSSRILLTALTTFLALLAALLGGEMLVRAVDPPVYDHPMRSYDPVLGWRGKPSGLFYRQVEDYGIRFETNSLGFRDREPHRAVAIPGPERMPIRRLLVFGDSYTESAQVELHETYWSLLKDRLNRRSERAIGESREYAYWEVQSFGVGDWGTTQQVLAYEQLGFPSDLVILQVFPLNDIANNSIAAANLASSQDAYRPYLDPAKDFRSVTYLNPRTSWLRQNTRLGRFLVQLAIDQRGPWGRERVFESHHERKATTEALARSMGIEGSDPYRAWFFNTFAPHAEQFEEIQVGWRATDIAIRRFAAQVKKRRAQLVVLVVPYIDQLGHRVEPIRASVPFKIDTRYAEKRIRHLLKEHAHVTVVGLVDQLEQELDTVDPLVAEHFNRPTHVLLADRLEEELLRLLGER